MSREGSDRHVKRNLLVVFGTLLGGVFLYLTFKDISLSELLKGMRRFDLLYLVPAFVVLLAIQLVRAIRFGLIIKPLCRLGLKDLWDIINIWGGLNMVMPARLAEFVKPYLLRQSGASFAGGVGAIMVERFFDLWGLLTLLALVLWRTPEIPAQYSLLGKLLLAGLTGGYLITVLILIRRSTSKAVVAKLAGVLPSRAASFVVESFDRVTQGLSIMTSVGQAMLIYLLSITVWVLFATLTHLFLKGFSIEAPLLAAVTVQVFICFGVALPSTPGFIGTFHAACRLALSLFGIAAIPAVSFATVYHVFTLIASVGLGLLSHARGRYSFDLRALGPGDSASTPRKAEDAAVNIPAAEGPNKP